MKSPATTFSIAIIVAIAAILAAGSAAPSPLTWGFHSFAFLSFSRILIFIVCAAILFRSASREGAGTAIVRCADRRPVRFLFTVLGAFIVLSVAARVRAPLLGDSFILINTLGNTFRGIHSLIASREPLGYAYFYGWVSVLEVPDAPKILDAFLAGEIVLGAGFIIIVWKCARLAFADRRIRVAAFLLVLTFPYMQLFFGYAEVYSVVLVLHALFLLSLLQYIRGGRLMFVTGSFILVGCASYLSLVILAPCILYVFYRSYRTGGFRTLVTSLVLTGVAVLGVLVWSRFDLQNILPPSEHAHYLTLSGAGDPYQAYGLLSGYHLIDIGNLLVLSALPLVPLVISGRRRLLSGELERMLMSIVIPFIGFLIIAKFDLPLAADWDVTAPYFFFAAFLSIAVSVAGGESVRPLNLLIVASLLVTVPFVMVNASVDGAIGRTESFLDKRISSREGAFQVARHLADYFTTAGIPDSSASPYRRFAQLFPDDPRGATYLVPYLVRNPEGHELEAARLFDQVLSNDTSNAIARGAYLNFILDAAPRLLKRGDTAGAIGLSERIGSLRPSTTGSLNAIGILWSELGRFERAESSFQSALAVDSTNYAAHMNLANISGDMGNPRRAIGIYGDIIKRFPDNPNAYWNLGMTCLSVGDTARGMNAIRTAARLGMKEAQMLLKSAAGR